MRRGKWAGMLQPLPPGAGMTQGQWLWHLTWRAPPSLGGGMDRHTCKASFLSVCAFMQPENCRGMETAKVIDAIAQAGRKTGSN